MKIAYYESGGIGGLENSFVYDSLKTTNEDSCLLKSLIEKAGFFELQVGNKPPTPDSFQYYITIEWRGRKRTIQTFSCNAPAKLKVLIRALSKRSKYSKH